MKQIIAAFSRGAAGGFMPFLKITAGLIALGFLLLPHDLPAQVPPLLNYQGRVQVGTNDFNGAGQFKFAIVNADGSTTYWSNDGTPSGQPAAAVSLSVSKGLYSVLLGNTNLPGMTGLPPTAFTNGDVHLRVWFNDGLNGFQQFVPDQRVVTPAYAMMAGSLTGAIGVDQLPPGIPRATNGTTTIAGNVVVQGTLTAAGVDSGGATGSSGLPAGTTLEVLINNVVAPGVRFEGLDLQQIRLSRVMTDMSWPDVFWLHMFTNAPVSIRLNLPNGGTITWSLKPKVLGLPAYQPDLFRVIGSDGRPYDYVTLTRSANGTIVRTNVNVSTIGSSPSVPLGSRASGQPVSSSLRLFMNGVNYNNVTLQGAIAPELRSPFKVLLNPTQHTALSDWAFNGPVDHRSVEVFLLNGLPGGAVSLGRSQVVGEFGGTYIEDYEVRLAGDGLPYESITLQGE